MKDKDFSRLLLVLLSSFIQASTILLFIESANTLPSGFTGLANIISIILKMVNVDLSISYIIPLLNFPVALLCYKTISKKFVLFSLLQITATSLLLANLPFYDVVVFSSIWLNILFGGFFYGVSVVFALKANASTGGTDFIAQHISNKIGKNIFSYVFIFNIFMYFIFGLINGFDATGYSIISNFITTYTITNLYDRYNQVTLQITTSKSESLIKAYIQKYKHGISVVNAQGGYSNKPMFILHTVVSVYEVNDIISLMNHIDSNVIINCFKTTKFHGGFYRSPIE